MKRDANNDGTGNRRERRKIVERNRRENMTAGRHPREEKKKRRGNEIKEETKESVRTGKRSIYMRINILSRTKNGMKTYAIRETHPRKKKSTTSQNKKKCGGKEGKTERKQEREKKNKEIERGSKHWRHNLASGARSCPPNSRTLPPSPFHLRKGKLMGRIEVVNSIFSLSWERDAVPIYSSRSSSFLCLLPSTFPLSCSSFLPSFRTQHLPSIVSLRNFSLLPFPRCLLLFLLSFFSPLWLGSCFPAFASCFCAAFAHTNAWRRPV